MPILYLQSMPSDNDIFDFVSRNANEIDTI